MQYNCPYCFAISGMSLHFTKKGKPTLICSRCNTRVFFNSREGHKGIKILSDLIEFFGSDFLNEVVKSPQFGYDRILMPEVEKVKAKEKVEA